MKVKLESTIKNARPLCIINEDEIVVSKNQNIYRYSLSENILKKSSSISVSFWKKIFMKSKLLVRLLRLGIRYGIKINEDTILVVFNKKMLEVNLKTQENRKVFDIIRGNGPLAISEVNDIAGFENGLIFGEYFTNFERDVVHIYQRKDGGSWAIAYTFPQGTMEHIHSIIPDKYNECLWILAGDFDEASCIWMAKNNFSEVIPVLRGSQNFRACVAFPTDIGLVYATDSQFMENSIRLLKKVDDQWESIEICSINGSSIYGCLIGDTLCFSTAVEGDSLSKGKFMRYLDRTPGPGIKKNESHIVMGNLKEGFHIALKRKKDMYPFLLFQFGAFIFPTGINNSDKLICYDIALTGRDMNTYIYKIKN